MGFKDAKKKVIECLETGRFQHELDRAEIEKKNLLHAGDVTPEEVAQEIRTTRGDEHTTSPHDRDKTTQVHIVKKKRRGKVQWYIKWYFMEPDVVFISVHH